MTDPAGTWIDHTRILARSREQEPVFIFDVCTGESRWIEIEGDEQADVITCLDGWRSPDRSDGVTNLRLVTLDDPSSE